MGIWRDMLGKKISKKKQNKFSPSTIIWLHAGIVLENLRWDMRDRRLADKFMKVTLAYLMIGCLNMKEYVKINKSNYQTLDDSLAKLKIKIMFHVFRVLSPSFFPNFFKSQTSKFL